MVPRPIRFVEQEGFLS